MESRRGMKVGGEAVTSFGIHILPIERVVGLDPI
jgi:hypothetical protein